LSGPRTSSSIAREKEMFDQLQRQYADEDRTKSRWNVRRAWIAIAITLLVLLIRHYEHLH